MKNLTGILAFALFLFPAKHALACKCAVPPDKVTQAEYDEVSLVFIGTAKNVTNAGGSKVVQFSVAEVLKGDPRMKEAVLHTPLNGAMCGLDIKTGRQWYIWAYWEESEHGGKTIYASNLCTRSLAVPDGIKANRVRYDNERSFLLQRRQSSGGQQGNAGQATETAFANLGKAPNLSLNANLIAKSCSGDYGADIFLPEVQGDYAEIRFENGIGDAMHIYGLSEDGFPKWEKTLRPGESYTQRTQTGVPWIVTDFSGCLGVYAAAKRNARTKVVAPQPPNIALVDCTAPAKLIPVADNRKTAQTVFINESGRTLRLSVMGNKGGKQFHSQLDAGGFVEANAFVGSVWVVEDTAGNCLAAYEITAAGNSYVTIAF